MGRMIAPACAGLVVGTALQLQQAQLWAAWAYAGLAAAGIFLILLASRRSMALPCGAMCVAFALTGLRAGVFAASALPPELEGRDISVTGVVASLPQADETGARFRFDVESASIADRQLQLPSRIQLGWYRGMTLDQVQSPDIRPGERWQFNVRLKAPHGHVNPHGFDYELWLWDQGVQATGYVRAGPRDPVPRRIGRTWNHAVDQLRHAVREALYARVQDRRMAGVLAALVVGDQAAIERADWDVFRATGVAHLMSISGLHVTMFAWLAAAVVGALWRRSVRLCLAVPAQHAALVGGIVLAAGYALFSGWGVPSQRTVWMLATVGLLRISGRSWPWPWVWLLACAVVVTADPWALMQPGFWLSFVAVGVLFASGDVRHSREGGKPEEPGKHFPAFAGMTRVAAGMTTWGVGVTKMMAREQWIVTLALTPLTLLLFSQVSLIGLAANLVAIPWVTLLVTPLAMAGVAFAPAWDAAALCVQWLAAALQWLAGIPMATVSVAAAPLWAGMAGVVGGLLVAMPLPWHMRFLGVPLMLPVLLWQPLRPPAGEFDLIAADVGQGNAVIVRTASHTLVYDAGPRYGPESDAGHRVLVPLLRQLGETVDTLVLSHRDSDHTGGAAAVLAMQPQAKLLASIEDAHELQQLRRATRCAAGQQWEWDGVRFEVMHPAVGAIESAAKPNAVSCVLRIANARASVLLAGDIEEPQEAFLVKQGIAPADVLLVPHHGSKTSSSDAFLDAVHPQLALVQAGYRNRFGHPAAQVIARYDARNVRTLVSASCGAMHWRSTTPRDAQCERQLAPRYWHHR